MTEVIRKQDKDKGNEKDESGNKGNGNRCVEVAENAAANATEQVEL